MGANALVAAGFSCCPMLYVIEGDTIQLAAKLDQAQKKEGGGVRWASGRARLGRASAPWGAEGSLEQERFFQYSR